MLKNIYITNVLRTFVLDFDVINGLNMMPFDLFRNKLRNKNITRQIKK